jgi:predicted ATPase
MKRREYISTLEVNNFTLFDKMKLEFAEGINIFIGENGTGKSQILKLLYTLTTVNNTFYKKNTNRETVLSELIVENIEAVFRGKRLQNLISFNFNKDESHINMGLSNYNINFSITEHTSSQVKINRFSTNGSPQKILFIPAKEILSNFKGFRNLWEEYIIPFDKTFYDLVKALDRPLLKDTSNIKKMNNALEDILDGEIIQENGEFLLKRNKDGKKVFSSMMAEGLRKIGTLSYLLKNNSLNNESILIWDEPEANLNPRTIQEIAKLLIALENFGVQIFIATHSLFLIKEIEILKKRETKVKYFGFGFDDNHNLRVSQNKEFDYLDDLVILDEEIAQSDRFMREVE